MVCLKSTTPEELYTRKIDSEEYGEALMLAKCYGLDCDLVYQRQWRKTDVTVASIQDYLVSILLQAGGHFYCHRYIYNVTQITLINILLFFCRYLLLILH